MYYKGNAACNAKLTIYDQVGNVVYHATYDRVGGNDTRAAEFARWDLNNRNGRKVASGIYLAVLLAREKDGSVKKYITKIGIKEE